MDGFSFAHLDPFPSRRHANHVSHLLPMSPEFLAAPQPLESYTPRFYHTSEHPWSCEGMQVLDLMSQAALSTNSVSSCHLLPPSSRNLQKPLGMALRADELKDPGGPMEKYCSHPTEEVHYPSL